MELPEEDLDLLGAGRHSGLAQGKRVGPNHLMCRGGLGGAP